MYLLGDGGRAGLTQVPVTPWQPTIQCTLYIQLSTVFILTWFRARGFLRRGPVCVGSCLKNTDVYCNMIHTLSGEGCGDII